MPACKSKMGDLNLWVQYLKQVCWIFESLGLKLHKLSSRKKWHGKHYIKQLNLYFQYPFSIQGQGIQWLLTSPTVIHTDKDATYRAALSSPPLHHKALASVIHLLPCVSTTSLCLPHLLGLNELWGLIMILLPAEKRFPSSVCIGDKPKTDVHMLSVVITETATLMCLRMWEKKTTCIWACRHVVSHLVCSHYPKYTDVCTINANWDVFYHTCCCTWCVCDGSSWPVRCLAHHKAALNRMEDFLWLSVRPEKRKCHQLRFYDIYCQSPHLHSSGPKATGVWVTHTSKNNTGWQCSIQICFDVNAGHDEAVHIWFFLYVCGWCCRGANMSLSNICFISPFFFFWQTRQLHFGFKYSRHKVFSVA